MPVTMRVSGESGPESKRSHPSPVRKDREKRTTNSLDGGRSFWGAMKAEKAGEDRVELAKPLPVRGRSLVLDDDGEGESALFRVVKRERAAVGKS